MLKKLETQRRACRLSGRMSFRRVVGLVLAVALLPGVMANAAVIGPTLIIEAKAPVMGANSASVDLWVSLVDADPNDLLLGVTLDVSGSSDGLTASGTDFSRFAFVPSGDPHFAGWTVGQFADPALDIFKADYWNWPSLTPGLKPGDGSVLVGQVVIDTTGLDLDDDYVLGLVVSSPHGGQGSTGIYLPAGSTSSGDIAFTGVQLFGTQGGEVVLPEPASALLIGGAFTLAIHRRRRAA